jgi:hypothetical protein
MGSLNFPDQRVSKDCTAALLAISAAVGRLSVCLA